jgi:hypothetical protein
MLTKEEVVEELEKIVSEFENPENLPQVIEDWLKIRTESGDILDFVPNEAQLKILKIMTPKLMKGEPIRMIILKARQQGISTLIQAIIFILLFVGSDQKALTMGHEIKSSNNLFNIYDLYYKELPKQLQPTLEYSNEKKKKYLANQCENVVDTAGKGEVGRSDTLQFLHLTEVAFYPDAKKTLGALLQAAKYAKMIIIESTANGIGDEFYNMYQEAKDPKSLSEYIPVFLSWLDFPKYSKPFASETEKEILLYDLGKNPLFNEYEDEEVLLQKKYNTTLEQLNWRRYTIVNTCQKDVRTFHQEYPRDDQEAFVATGRPVFSTQICSVNYTDSKIAPWEGNLEYIYGDDKEPINVQFVRSPKGFIRIYDRFNVKEDEEYRFAAGCDVAEGLGQGDYSVIKVLDRKTMKMILTWHGHVDPDLLATEIHKLQLFLKNKWYINIERNNHGLTTIVSAYKLGVTQKYQQNFTKGYEVKGNNEIGFKTNIGTKPTLINNLGEFIREGSFKDSEKEFWSEAMTFVRNDRGQMQAQGKDKDSNTKCYDDRVIATALAIDCHLWMPPYYVDDTENLPDWYDEEFGDEYRYNSNKVTAMGV